MISSTRGRRDVAEGQARAFGTFRERVPALRVRNVPVPLAAQIGCDWVGSGRDNRVWGDLPTNLPTKSVLVTKLGEIEAESGELSSCMGEVMFGCLEKKVVGL